ncbi:imidazolonepropionase [Halomonas sp.]|uniref:imidazolonepropionase n=1 Tax=Halomonas sp. TaxID=1486246 RepID=UPI00356206BD
MTWDTLWTNCHAATMVPSSAFGAIDDAAIAVRDWRIAWIGPRAELEDTLEDAGAHEVVDLEGRWVTPGLIDCHTHLVYGGDRAAEFEMRLEGADYEAIVRAGGGIVSSVRATRAASFEQLCASAERRARELLAEGVTVLEIKSGYGLDEATEARMLTVARHLGETLPATVRTTCLAANALPPEYAERPDDYIDLVCERILPQVAEAGLADAVDAFCERIAFDTAQTERVFRTAHALGLPVKLHAEQLSDQGGTQLAARYDALSMDHVEYVSAEGVAAMAAAGSVAVLLPGAFYTLRETQVPPIAAFREHGVPMVVATDANPGTSPARSLLLMLNMACTQFRLTPEEALAGVTREAARALDLADDYGTLETGKRADLVAWDIDQPAELAYWIGMPRPARILRHGQPPCNQWTGQ